MTRPLAPWFSNRTRPAIFAKIVSSLPSPAFSPARNRRPRWADDDRSAGDEVCRRAPLHRAAANAVAAGVSCLVLFYEPIKPAILQGLGTRGLGVSPNPWPPSP